jgi:hypothetical protein
VLLLALVADHFGQHGLELAPALLEQLVRRREVRRRPPLESAVDEQLLGELALAGAAAEGGHIEAPPLGLDLRLRGVQPRQSNRSFDCC